MRRVISWLVIATCAAVTIVAVTSTATASTPPGATARCRDGTYSYSQHRSGTCSYHGGVAVWLTGGGATSGSTTSLAAGSTVFLALRTRASGCRPGSNPDRRCSPGAYYSKLSRSVICSSSFHTRSIRNVPQSEKYDVEREYGMAAAHYGTSLEIDHIVSLELGGSNDIANLFPEKANANPGYHVKDKLENRLHDLVCDGTFTLRTVQRRISSDWQALYKSVYGIAPTG